MSDMKTVENDGSVEDFLQSVANERRREDAIRVVRMMEDVTGEQPRMWGDSIIGFGRYTYRRSDKSEHNWMLTGVSPRKAALTVYIMPGFSQYGSLLAKTRQTPPLDVLPVSDPSCQYRFRCADRTRSTVSTGHEGPST